MKITFENITRIEDIKPGDLVKMSVCAERLCFEVKSVIHNDINGNVSGFVCTLHSNPLDGRITFSGLTTVCRYQVIEAYREVRNNGLKVVE